MSTELAHEEEAASVSTETATLKKFAQNARRMLLESVASKLDVVLAEGSLARRESEKAIAELEDQIEGSSKEQVVEAVAYTWFNRFCAFRFMDANRYTRIGTVSPSEGFTQPELLADAKQGVIDDDLKVKREKVFGLLDGSEPSQDPQGEAYKLLLVAVCNHYHSVMPFMFEKIADYTELLIPDDLLSDSSILTATREALTPENCQNVEVIGWLYQFYISEKKDDVFAALKKGKKITPENIPAATQLFTPHWIVRYLVENSLGRLWMLNHPDSRLVEQMDYYIRPEEPETDFLRISSPEEIKICDPACGSGHMLTYAFDLLYAIYEEQGYQATDIPRLILTHNLYGIEIDQRAGALAAFALTMKAREKYRRFLTGGKVVQPNICVLENISIDPEDLSAYMDKVGRDLFSGGLQGVVNQWEEADNFGSLIRPLVTDVSEVQELLALQQMGEDLFLAGVHQKVLKALRQADYLSPKYHVVVANPPFMGQKGMSSTLKAFVSAEYSAAKHDTFSCFILRCIELSNSSIGMVTPYVWMFISSFESLRSELLNRANITSLIQLEYNAFEPACVPVCTFTLEVPERANKPGTFIRLSEFRGHESQAPKTLEAIADKSCGYRFVASKSQFEPIPGTPIAYWVSPAFLKHYESGRKLSDLALPRVGCQTSDNERFLRTWFEVECRKFSPKGGGKWYPYYKGGKFRRWFGNRELVINWENEGKEVIEYATELYKSPTRTVKNQQYYFREGITWSTLSSSKMSFRFMEAGGIFDTKGSACFAETRKRQDAAFLLLNSNVAQRFIEITSPTLDYSTSAIGDIPLSTNFEMADQSAQHFIDVAKKDWDTYETSWDFPRHPLVSTKNETLTDAFNSLRDDWRFTSANLKTLEEENNRRLIDAYDLSDELTPDVQLEDVSLFCNPSYRYDADKSESELEALLLADTMREFISYAVGCMLGRYSLDKPGLILANQGETADDYRQQIPEPTFAPDEDNVIPLLDGDWFEDDITERFKAFLKVTFGTEHYEENLTFLENSLFPANSEGKKRKTIRDYFLKEFYNHHIKLYKKRPIYWLFSSPKGTFNALIYMHRYRPDTVSVVLNDYLREFHTKLTAKVDHLQTVADSSDASKSEKTVALKEITTLKKQLKELEDYERDTLFPLAQQQVEIDLDDGVKVNYNKFGKALKKVTGLS